MGKIKGVEYTCVDKQTIADALVSGEGFHLGDVVDIDVDDKDEALQFSKFFECIQIVTAKDKTTSQKLRKSIDKFLDSNTEYEYFVNTTTDEGEHVRILTGQNGGGIVCEEDDDETNFVLISGEKNLLDLLMSAVDSGIDDEDDDDANNHLHLKEFNVFVNDKTIPVFSLDDNEEASDKINIDDALIIIDGKIYPDLHSQDDAANYMNEHGFAWHGKHANLLFPKEKNQLYPNTPKIIAFEYFTEGNGAKQIMQAYRFRGKYTDKLAELVDFFKSIDVESEKFNGIDPKVILDNVKVIETIEMESSESRVAALEDDFRELQFRDKFQLLAEGNVNYGNIASSLPLNFDGVKARYFIRGTEKTLEEMIACVELFNNIILIHIEGTIPMEYLSKLLTAKFPK